MGGLFAADNLSARFNPFAEHSAPHVAWRDLYAGIISHAFHFSGYADGVSVYFRAARIETGRWVRGKPHRRFHAIAIFLEGFEVQIFFPGKRRKAHRISPTDGSIHNARSRSSASMLRTASITDRRVGGKRSPLGWKSCSVISAFAFA